MAKISKADLIRLQKKLKTDAAIGAEFGVTRQAIHQLRKKYGIESRTAGNKDRNAEIIQMRDDGKSVEAIAKKYSISIPQTYRIIKLASAGAKKAVSKKTVAKPAKKEVSKKTRK